MAVYENSRYLNTTMYHRNNIDTNVLIFKNIFTFYISICISYEWIKVDTLDCFAFKYYVISALR